MMKTTILAATFFVLILFSYTSVCAQESTPDGDSTYSILHLRLPDGTGVQVAVTGWGWYVAQDGHAPDIRKAMPGPPNTLRARKGHPDQFILTGGLSYEIYQAYLSGGNIALNVIDSDRVSIPGSTFPVFIIRDIGGRDDIHVLGYPSSADYSQFGHTVIAVKRTGSNVWTLDTVGLQIAPYYMILDTNGGMYAYTDKLLFKTEQGASFAPVPSLNTINHHLLFIADNNDIFASVPNGAGYALVWSQDNMLTWDTLHATMQPYCEVAGSLYTYYSSQLSRSDDLGATWIRVDSTLRQYLSDTTQDIGINDLTGDSVLYLSSRFGAFVSRDKGGTWMPATDGTGSAPYGYTRFDDERQVATTRLGIFVKDGASAWSHVYPTDGKYLYMTAIQTDDLHNLYTYTQINGAILILKSTDEGDTWQPDTAGLAQIQSPFLSTYYVDETGASHMQNSYLTYAKPAGGSYQADTLGYGRFGPFMMGFASDHSGFLYGINPQNNQNPSCIWRRPIANGSRWAADSVIGTLGGLFGVNNLNPIAYDQHHGVNAARADCCGQIYHRYADAWRALPATVATPSRGSNYLTKAVTGTLRGAIIAAVPFTGIYCSRDTGRSWDTVDVLNGGFVRSFSDYADTTYVLSPQGLYKISCLDEQMPTSISVISKGVNCALHPNPSQGECHLLIKDGDWEHKSCLVLDMTGRVVLSLPITGYDTTIPESNMTSGSYICAIQKNGQIVDRCKMVIR